MKGGSSKDGGTLAVLGFILEVELTGHADGLEAGSLDYFVQAPYSQADQTQ